MRMRLGLSIALKALELIHWLSRLESAGLLRELADMIQAPTYAV